MDNRTLFVKKSKNLEGTISIGGSKNSSLSCMAAACVLNDGSPVILKNVPDLTDIDVMSDILRQIGKKVERNGNDLEISGKVTSHVIPNDMASQIRGSTYFLGLLLGLKKKVTCGLPGGDKIGDRPIDIHLKAFEKMGATSKIKGSTVELSVKGRLKGESIFLRFPSVGATCNIMIAAAFADGETTIQNAAKEPEIVDLANLLCELGVFVIGAGTDRIRVMPASELRRGVVHEVIPDRIETGAFLALVSAVGGKVTLNNAVPYHNAAFLSILEECGVDIETQDDAIHITSDTPLRPFNITCMPYPSMATDLQPFLTTLALNCVGESIVTDMVFPERFSYVYELVRMGGAIERNGNKLRIVGKSHLFGTKVEGNDIRASFALIIAGANAKDVTEITGSEQLFRGFEDIERKLQSIGVNIEIK